MRQMVKFNTVPDFGCDHDEIGIYPELCVAFMASPSIYSVGKKSLGYFAQI